MINVLFLFLFFSVSFASSTVYQRYFTDTYLSLEAVRNHSTGLVPDSYTVNLTTLLDPTSPSNIGLDLLMQLEALDRPALQTKAKQNIQNVLKTLKQLPYHKSSGLFFNRYATDGKSVKDYYI